MTRTGIELIAFGRLRSGSLASAAVVPTSSIPTNAVRSAGIVPSSTHCGAAASAWGSAKLILETSEHPISLLDQVCSPGGTTP